MTYDKAKEIMFCEIYQPTKIQEIKILGFLLFISWLTHIQSYLVSLKT